MKRPGIFSRLDPSASRFISKWRGLDLIPRIFRNPCRIPDRILLHCHLHRNEEAWNLFQIKLLRLNLYGDEVAWNLFQTESFRIVYGYRKFFFHHGSTRIRRQNQLVEACVRTWATWIHKKSRKTVWTLIQDRGVKLWSSRIVWETAASARDHNVWCCNFSTRIIPWREIVKYKISFADS